MNADCVVALQHDDFHQIIVYDTILPHAKTNVKIEINIIHFFSLRHYQTVYAQTDG